MKRVFIIHGWDFSPEQHWYPWLKEELEKKGFIVQVPEMPDSAEPKIAQWVSMLAKCVGTPDKDTFFVGHSIGCPTILKYLESVNQGVGGAVFVAGWFTLQNLETPEIEAIAKPWVEMQIDFTKVKKTTQKFVAFFSDNDPFVSLSNARQFEERLGARTMVEKNKGHYTMETKISEVPAVLQALLDMAK